MSQSSFWPEGYAGIVWENVYPPFFFAPDWTPYRLYKKLPSSMWRLAPPSFSLVAGF